MAERRMFARAVVNSGRFLRLQPTARLLYYDLGMHADDDGIVEAYSVITQTRANEDDLRILCNKGFVQVLNEDLVAVITDWKTNNSIRGDRYHPSIYKHLLGCQPSDNQVTTNCQPSDNQMETETRLDKTRLDKDRLGKVSKDKTRTDCNGLWSLLSEEEEKRLLEEYDPLEIGALSKELNEQLNGDFSKIKSAYGYIKAVANNKGIRRL